MNLLVKKQNCHFWERKNDLKRTEKYLKELKAIKYPCLRHLKKTKKKQKELKRHSQVFSFYCFPLFLLYVSHITILIALAILSSFQFLHVILLYLERCSNTTRGVRPPSFQGQLIIFKLRALDPFFQQETKKKGRHDCNEKKIPPL